MVRMQRGSPAPVRSTDGLDLAVYEQGPEGAETIVLVHGYPDNHTVWDGVAELLAEDFHVVRYDVRGHGASEVPATTSGYALPLLSQDLRSVIEATSPDSPVHLVAHDWGSIQSWESVLDPAFTPLLRSYVSISGPSLDAAGVWLRRGFRHPRAMLKQLAASYYVFAFQLPPPLERQHPRPAGRAWRSDHLNILWHGFSPLLLECLGQGVGRQLGGQRAQVRADLPRAAGLRMWTVCPIGMLYSFNIRKVQG